MWPLQRYPQDRASTETYPVPLTRVVYIERADFRVEDAKDYYGLAPGKSAMLRLANRGAAVLANTRLSHASVRLPCETSSQTSAEASLG